MPKPLRGIFRKRRKLLTLLFQVAIECLREWFRTRLDLPDGELAAIAGVQSFGDYLVFHPHLHILIAAGLIDRGGRFHEMPVESVEPLEELFRSRFLVTLRREKLISEKKQHQLLGWTHSGFLQAGDQRPQAAGTSSLKSKASSLTRAELAHQEQLQDLHGWRIEGEAGDSQPKAARRASAARQFLASAVEHIPPLSDRRL